MRYLKIGALFLITFVIYFSFGFHHIGKFITADEHLWIYDRIPRYWSAISTQNWKKTYVHEKPGITLAIISGTGLLKYPGPTNYLRENQANKTGTTQPLENMLTAFRLPVLIFNGLFSLFFFWILFRITKNKWIALWSSILNILSPSLLGMSQIVNSDSLLWTFATATILSFIAYLETSKKKFAVLTSLFLGLSMLTKFTATILLPFLFIISIIFFLEKNKDYLDKKAELAKKILQSAIAFFLIIVGSLATFAILLPASFFKLKECLYDGTIGYSNMAFILLPISVIQLLLIAEYFWMKNKLTITILEKTQKVWSLCSKAIYAFLALIFLISIFNYFFGHDFLNLEKVPFDARQGAIFKDTSLLKKIFLEARPTVFSLTPLVIFFCLFLWIKSLFSNTKERFIVFTFSTFIIIYTAAIIQQDLLNIIRYNVIIYPAFSILAAIGIYYFIPKNKKSEWIYLFATILILFFSLISLWKIKPFYFNYSNFFLPKKYVTVDSWGYGGYEAAKYLNSLPDAEKKTIWTDYYGVCEFFKGNCLIRYSINQAISPIDYFVFTRRGKIRYDQKMKDKSFVKKSKNLLKLKPYYEEALPLWEIQIDNRPENYIKILPNQL
ncbi:MAG: phospholipid carrier-dependent glycosyltransferase [Candidatus Moraniibacteriota bacterium]